MDVGDLRRLQIILRYSNTELENSVKTIRTIFRHKKTDQSGNPRDKGRGYVRIDVCSAALQQQLLQQGILHRDNQIHSGDGVFIAIAGEALQMP